MSATVTSMSSFVSRRVDVVETEREALKNRLRGLIDNRRYAEALARYDSNVARGVPADESRKRVVAWAFSSTDPNTPSPIAA